MGFQSSFNQLLAAGSGAILGVQHVAEQKQANMTQALNGAVDSIDKSVELKGQVKGLNKQIQGANNEEAELSGYINKLDERRAETQANMEGTSGRTLNAYRQQLNQQNKAREELVAKYEENRNLRDTLKERREILQARVNIQQQKNEMAQKALDKYGIKLGGKNNGK